MNWTHLAAFVAGGFVGYRWAVWAVCRAVQNGKMKEIVSDYEAKFGGTGSHWYPKASSPPPPAPPAPPIVEGRDRGNVKCGCRPMPSGPPPYCATSNREGQ